MNPAHGISALVRQFVFLAVLGAAFLFLIGPAIAVVAFVFSMVLLVVSVVLPFALVGVLVWVPLRLVRHGPRAAWKDVRQVACTIGGVAVALPVRSCIQVCRQAHFTGQHVRERARGISCRHGWTVMEMLCGGLVGGLVGTSLALQGAAFHPGTIIGGAFFGAVLGYLVGRSRATQTRESAIG